MNDERMESENRIVFISHFVYTISMQIIVCLTITNLFVCVVLK